MIRRWVNSHALIYLGLAAFVAAWWYAATLEWRAEREAARILDHKVSPRSFTRIPLAAEPQRRAAQRLLVSNSPDYPYIDALLADAIARRPLYAPYWLDRAEAAYQAGRPGDAERYAGRARRLWPTRPVLLWKAAMLYTRMGDSDAALATLRSYLHADPGGLPQALAVALRLQPDPAAMLAALVPDRFPRELTRDDMLHAILKTARARDDTQLAAAAWRGLTPDARRRPDIATHYVEWLAARGDAQAALDAWRTYQGAERIAPLENGGFERDLEGGLGWRAYNIEPVALSRDPHRPAQGQNSLKVAFSGNENINFYHLRQYLPVEPGTRYTIDYAWRGERITTRSGPYLSIRSAGAGRIARSRDRWGTWSWERDRLEFTAPAATRFVELRLRRNRTDALDNKIAGTLWLDDFTLTAEGRQG